MCEVWKQLPIHAGYRVSNLGNVESNYSGAWKPLKLRQLDGYFRFKIKVNGRRIYIPVHRIVAELFVGPRPPGLEIIHKNNKKWDNRDTNLRYGTHSDNVRNISSGT